MRELEGDRVEFVRDEGGVVTKIVFHQLNGSSQARREIA